MCASCQKGPAEGRIDSALPFGYPARVPLVPVTARYPGGRDTLDLVVCRNFGLRHTPNVALRYSLMSLPEIRTSGPAPAVLERLKASARRSHGGGDVVTDSEPLCAGT